MNVVDSSAWLEYFANGSNASFFAPAIEQTEELLVPSWEIGRAHV
jgi:toxin FitB